MVFGVGVINLFQTPVLEPDGSASSSTLGEVSPSRPDSAQVENFGVTGRVNNAILVSDQRLRAGCVSSLEHAQGSYSSSPRLSTGRKFWRDMLG